MLQAFLNKKEVKDKFLKRVQDHYKADEIIQGVYWENGKGCAVGCTLEMTNKVKNIHQAMEDQLGVPKQLAYLEDRIFEGLTNGEAKMFPVKFLKAIKVGADLSKVIPQFLIWLLVDPKDGVIKYARPDGKKAIRTVATLYRRKLKGEKIKDSEWNSARKAYASYAAADAAAYAAADAAAYAAADAAAYAAADAAAYAADAAYAAYAAADAADAARQKHYSKMAKKLLSLLKEAK